MSNYGFKNFMKITLFNDDSFQPLLKKNDQSRKTTQLSIDHYQSITKNYEALENSYGKILSDYDQLIDSGQLHVPQYYHQYTQLYRNMHIELRYFSEKLSNNFKELTSLCSDVFTNYSDLILNFQNIIRSYKSHQQILCELSKKYFRSHKTMISLIESYKNSFTDVKLIYNMDEKNKRFNACEANYCTLSEELKVIQQKLRKLNEERQLIMNSYAEICKQFKLSLKSIGSKLVVITRSFIADHCALQKSWINYLSQKKFTLQKIDLKTFFHSDSKFRDEQYFNVEIDRSRCEIFPSFVVYCDHIKDQYLHDFSKLATSYIKDLEAKIEERVLLNKKIFQVTSSFLKIYEKYYYLYLKQIMSNFEKIKKNVSTIFGSKLASFMKSIFSVFEISVGINEKLIKRTPAKFKIIENALNQETKIEQMFIKQLKSSVEKFLKKKQIKKFLEQGKQGDQFTQQQVPQGEILAFKKQLSDFSQFLSHLIQGFVDKIRKNQEDMKFQYNAFVNDVFISINQIYSLCCDYQDLYFGEANYANNYAKYQTEIDKALENQAKFFEEINFGILLKPQENPKIIFQSQMNKVDEYKKIRKPVQIQMEEQSKKQQAIKDAVIEAKVQNIVQETEIQRKNSADKSEKSEKKQKIQRQNTDKNEQFLGTKVQYLPNEIFRKSFSCGLSDKIILTGRLYITNKRLCFHSSFNPSNIFFGETFIQIPRKDIRKVQKRFNAIVFDNSISVTTVHGQVFFTSFFSRNEAYDLICEAMDLNQEQLMFEPQEIKEHAQVQVGPIEQQDDLNEESVPLRYQLLENQLAKYDYKELLKCQFCSPGLNAFKVLKMFQLGQQFTYNRKTYKSWSIYYKEILEHKDYEFGEWTPNIYEYLNSSNIKKNTPQKFTRKITCSVPIKNSGVPFMPKSAKSQQTITIFIFSKDKYVVESSIQNSGVPYSDTFNIKLRRIYQTAGQNRCKMTVQIYLNFLSETIMRSMIQSKAFEESKSGFVKYDEEVSKYLRYLQKMKAKIVKSDGSGKEEGLKNNGAIEQLQKQISQLKQIEEKTNKQLKIYKEKQQISKKLFIGSLLLNIVLILILIV